MLYQECISVPKVTPRINNYLLIMALYTQYYWPNGIQIKICAEYRDMLPRPRLVCQEPGLRPIGRSPGVPDKSSRAYFLFYSIHFPIFFIPLWVWLGTLQDCQYAQLVPSAIVHCNQNEAGHQTIKAPSMPCWDAAGPSKHSLALKSQPGENDR